ncbi:hypothetical protein RUND412_003634 [Rhizina undulata]
MLTRRDFRAGAANTPPSLTSPPAPIITNGSGNPTALAPTSTLPVGATVAPPALPVNSAATANSSPSKRKRSDSGTPGPGKLPEMAQQPQQSPLRSTSAGEAKMAAPALDENTELKRKQVLAKIQQLLLVVLKEHDTTPSTLYCPLDAASVSSSSSAPPNKRTKLSDPPLNTIADKLASNSYPSFNPLLVDITNVCNAVRAGLKSIPHINGFVNGLSDPKDNSGSSVEKLAQIARVVHFEKFAKELISRELLHHADLFDFTEEITDEEGRPLRLKVEGEKVALTVMGTHGPLFSSLQKPTHLAPASITSVATSPISSISSSQSVVSTAATTAPPSPSVEYSVFPPINEANLPPLVSTVKAIPSSKPQMKSPATKKDNAASTTTKDNKVMTFGEAFPPVRRLPPLAAPKPGQPANATIGLKWGGVISVGGMRNEHPTNDRPEPVGEWIRYASYHKPTEGFGIPADFVAAYSSFAPTKDDSGARMSVGMKNRVWWERHGKSKFRKMFVDDPGIGHLYREYGEKKEGVGEIVDLSEAKPSPAVEIEDDAILKAIEEWDSGEADDMPIDLQLLESGARKDSGKSSLDNMDPQEILTEISNLLQSLKSQQYIRLSTLPPDPPPKPGNSTTPVPVLGTPNTPTAEEMALYNTLQNRFTELISRLPPHLVATIDGTATGDLNVSTKIPIFTNGTPVYKGALPSEDAHLPKPTVSTPQVQGAAIAAMNAAAGLSPIINTAPVAMMGSASPTIRQNVPVPAPPQPVRMAPTPHMLPQPIQQYHGHIIPHHAAPVSPYPQFHGHHIPQQNGTGAGSNVTTPHHYPTPYNPAPIQYPQQRLPQQTPPPPRVITPNTPRAQPVTPQFHGHSLPPLSQPFPHPQMSPNPAMNQLPPPQPQGYPSPYPYPQHQQQPVPRQRVNVPPPQGLAAVGVGGGGYGYVAGPGGGLRMGVQHTPQSMGGAAVVQGRYNTPARRR